MSTYFLSLMRGQSKDGQVAIATSAPTADVYVQISTTNSPTKKDVLLLLKVIIRYIFSNGLPNGTSDIGADLPVL